MNRSPKVPVSFTSNYAAELLELSRGRGCWLWGGDGRRYLDFGSGIAVNALGHTSRTLSRIVYNQMKRVTHTSNLFVTRPSHKLATEILTHQPFATRRLHAVFFGNSGTEANEAALKFATFYREPTADTHYRPRFACFENGFHGRTLGALSVTPQRKYQRSLYHLVTPPLVLPYNDVASLETLSPAITAVIVEVVQGEGGLRAISREFAARLNQICRRHNIVLIADEVQSALGRTGALYASELVGLEPDILTLAKPLGGGLPLSATLVTKEIDNALSPGLHGSTFGGGPVTTAAGRYVWRTLSNQHFLDQIKTKAQYLEGQLHNLAQRYKVVSEVRGMGMLQGIVCDQRRVAVSKMIEASLERALIVLRSGENVLRIAPPLNITQRYIDQGCAIIDEVLSEAEAGRLK